MALKDEQNYENFIAVCPICGHRNIYNRCTDLKTFKPISGRDVECFNCHKTFRITGDLVCLPYEYLYYDCSELIKQKRYMYCIINLSQSIEMFLIHAIRVKLLWQPCQEGIITKLDTVNSIWIDIDNKLKKAGFNRLRNIFFGIYLNQRTFSSESDISNYINGLKNCKMSSEKEEEDIRKYPDSTISALFMKLKATKVNKLRNKVVHKHGYRPSLEEVKDCQKETDEIIFSLATRLKIEWKEYYLNRWKRR